ncbi:MAG: isoprenylcysteine carboxylmethyltransferase family protein [Acidobacteria bacterium]|nr:isoprenylcysteine carboxylmethyltransferase family protein [Acidobacteriota bacterium]
MGKPQDHAGILVPPPFIYAGFFLAGAVLDRLSPLPQVPFGIARPVGAVLAAVWLVLMAWSVRRFWSSGTSIIPVRPATALVTEGPYRFSRNPMYLGLLLLYAAVALWFGFVWSLLLVPPLVWVIRRAVIEREEQYLEREFGDGYRRYRASVRRWI